MLEQVVERPDPPREERGTPTYQVSLDPLDVTAGGDDEPRIVFEHLKEALQEQRDLAGMSRAEDEREAHRSIVVLCSRALSYVRRRLSAKSGELLRTPGAARRDERAGGLRGRGLGSAPAARNGLTGHPGSAVVAQIGLLRAAAGVRVIDPHYGSPALVDLGTTLVTHEDGLSRHDFSLRSLR